MRLEIEIDERFCEVAKVPRQVEEALRDSRREIEYLRGEARREQSELKVTRLGRQLQRHGRFLRLVGRFEDAREVTEEAMAIWEQYGRARALVVCRIQLSEIDLGGSRVEEAVKRLERLSTGMEEKAAVYADQIAEVRGRSLAAAGDAQAAREALKEALEVRQQRGNERHIEMTKALMERI